MSEMIMENALLRRIIGDAIAQKRVVKWGYVRQFGGLYPSQCDTVAAHSNAIAVLAVLLASELAEQMMSDLGVKLKVDDVSLMATFHDYGEGRSGDTGAASMGAHGVCNLHSLEREGLEASLHGLRIGPRILRLFDDYRAYRTPEAILVHVADNLEGVEKGLHSARGSREILDQVKQIVHSNLAVYRERAGVSPELGSATKYLVKHILLPGLQLISDAYGEDIGINGCDL